MSSTNKNNRNNDVSKRVYSFSVPDGDLSGHKAVTKMKKHCKSTGKSFSFEVIKGIEAQLKELGLD